MKSIGVLGGTFNPIHIGHLRGAIECRELLGLDEVLLLPAARPPLKQEPLVAAHHRAHMAAIAIHNLPGLSIDTRELNRAGASYTVDTLTELRQELGENTSLTFIIGADSLESLHRWHRWQSIIELANLAVMPRPGSVSIDMTEAGAFLLEREVSAEQIANHKSGTFTWVEKPPLNVSSTRIRDGIAQGKNVQLLMPDPVMQYIVANQLYRG